MNMKKNLALLLILLAMVFKGFAQDTITGTVASVDAPFFEQNVCDSRFAIISEGETYYVMVDNYWPNPYLEDLVIHYDTIAVGDEIEVVGTIVEMEDGNGEFFQTIDISKNLNSTHQQIVGFFGYNNIIYPGPDTISAARFLHYNGMDWYYLTINGELQTQRPFVINGRTLVWSKRYLFIGDIGTLMDYNGNSFHVFEIADALPYEIEDVSIDGILTLENNLCLSSPNGETSYLSLFDGEEHRYLTQKRKLQNKHINDTVFKEGDSVEVGGFEFTRHDLFGASFKSFEFIKVQSHVEHIVVGGVGDAPMPYIGPGTPVPGVDMAFYSDNIDYYLENPQGNNGFWGFYVIGNDTVPVTMQQVKASLVASIFVNNYLNPCYRAYINHVEFEEHEESLQCTLTVASNPFYGGDMLVVKTHDDETYYLKPYIYEYNAPDHITVGVNTIYIGDTFNATGMVSNWYQDQYNLKKVIDIISVEFVKVQESYSPEIQVSPNPSNGIVEINSENPIEYISAYDSMGGMIFNKTSCSRNITLDLSEHKGLVLLHIIFQDGHKITKKEIIK